MRRVIGAIQVVCALLPAAVGNLPPTPAPGPLGRAVPVAARTQAPIPDCSLGFTPAKPIEGVGSIIGTAWAQCDVQPESHVITVGLQLREAGAWVTIGTSPPDSRLPPGPPNKASYQVRTPCRVGAWRVTATAHGYGTSGIPFSYTDHSMNAIISCRRGTK